MRQMLLCLAASVVGGVVALSLDLSQLVRKMPRIDVQPAATVKAPAAEANPVEPVIAMPARPPRFLYDLVEPIIVQPEFAEPALATRNETAAYTLVAPPQVDPAPARMPYADEPSTVADTGFLQDLLEAVVDAFPGSDPVSTTAESQEPTTPPETGPEFLAPLQMPLYPDDPHHHYPGCPGLGGCTRGYPHYPHSQYQFPRPMPASPEPAQADPTEEAAPDEGETPEDS